MLISNTGYEFSRVELKKLSPIEIKEIEEIEGLCCEKCENTKGDKWYVEKLINNYLPDYRLICEKCI